MSRYLLDTNHLSPLVTFSHPLRTRIMRQMDNGDEFGIAVVALSEFLFGIQIVPRAKSNIVEWRRLQTGFGYYAIDQQDAEKAANIQLLMRQRGRQVATVDAFIATIAIRYELTLLTTDQDFEFIPYLPLENWL